MQEKTPIPVIRLDGSCFKVPFDGTTLGYIVRNKLNVHHKPRLDTQHADCILPYGYLTHYSYGEPLSFPQFSDLWKALQKNLKGGVNNISYLMKLRPRCAHVHTSAARRDELISTAMIFKVTKDQAEDVVGYWNTLYEKPGNFNILTNNCATHASKALEAAKIIQPHRGILSPEKLFQKLYLALIPHGGFEILSGYIGFEQQENREHCYDLYPNNFKSWIFGCAKAP